MLERHRSPPNLGIGTLLLGQYLIISTNINEVISNMFPAITILMLLCGAPILKHGE